MDTEGRDGPGSGRPLRDRLLSHRVRGTGHPEGSLPALEAVLALEPAWIEIDTRVTADGRVLVYHDTRLEARTDRTGKVCDHAVAEDGRPRYREAPGVEVPLLEEFLEVFEGAAGRTRIAVDIKDRGHEEAHLSALRSRGLLDDAWIIAWDPGILRRVAALAPGVPLGFSYVPLTRWKAAGRVAAGLLRGGGAVRAAATLLAPVADVHNLRDLRLRPATIEPTEHGVGSFPIHLLDELPPPSFLELLRASGGGLGAPAALLDADYARAVRRRGLDLFTFSVETAAAARGLVREADPDVIFTDDAALFERRPESGDEEA